MKRTLRIVVLAFGAILIEALALSAVASVGKAPGQMLDGHWYIDPVMRAFNIAAMVLAMFWAGVGIWQLYKRVPFRFLAWGIAVIYSGVIFYLAMHG